MFEYEIARLHSEGDLADWPKCQKVLNHVFSWHSQTQRHLDANARYLEAAISIMAHHKLGEHEGRKLDSLRAQLKYRGRTLFKRQLSTTTESRHDTYYSAGLDSQEGFPGIKRLYFTFTLESEDRTRCFRVLLGCQVRSDSTYLDDSKLSIEFERCYIPSFYDVPRQAYLNRRKTRFDSWRHAPMPSEHYWEDAVTEAFRKGGFISAWKMLDKVWLDISASRPMNRPLNQLSLEARHWLHFGQDVKVFTPKQTFAGAWQHTFEDTSGKISGVRIQLARSGKSVEIPGEQIYELLPCRLEMES